MHAEVGDELVVQARRQGEPSRRGEILEVHGAGGSEPFVVRWDDSGRTGLVFPGADATVVAAPARTSPVR
ncbi:DUF1918 domain-containing protein [Amnibacterium kyonggiense]|uniref:Uncharacterized protein DUF1918 n=1 Tax=Amnibacterium kyonggiense TaxID=595671 RepID=A0A4R7FKI9_9MICO|nr:DUF1918 domain-containing protein [Amnibacterium kyonggiense]TDS76873.1 uncharacterized protein DUF1918 [Amnibacterium kyonggiense]